MNNDLYAFLYSVLSGVLIGIAYDVFKVKRKYIYTKNIYVNIKDLIFWAVTLIIMFWDVYYGNDGELRGYIWLGSFLGLGIYVCLLRMWVEKVLNCIFGSIIKIYNMVIKCFIYPCRKIKEKSIKNKVKL